MVESSFFGGAPRAGLEIRAAHFPGRAAVDSYGNGGFRFADMSHKGSILCLPSGIYGWDVAAAGDLTTSDFDQVMSEEGLELLLFGSGTDLKPPAAAIREALQQRNIRLEIMNTGAAARTFNVLLAEGRAVGAALLAVD